MHVAKKPLNQMADTITLISEASSAAAAMELEKTYEIVTRLTSSNAVVLFSFSGCCMCTVAKRLLFSLGVGPTIIELDHHVAGSEIQPVLLQLFSNDQHQTLVPAIFVGGKFLGGIETLMARHINGTLVPLLKNAGALWL